MLEEIITTGNCRMSDDASVYALTEGEALTLKYYDAANKRILTFNNPIKKR